MSVDRRTQRWVALGETTSRASQVFAATLDDLVLETYDAVPSGGFGAGTTGVAFAAGVGQVDAMSALLGDPELGEAKVELPEDPTDGEAAAAALRSSGWVVTGLSSSASGTWIAELGRAAHDEPVLPYAMRSSAPAAPAAGWPAARAAEAPSAAAAPAGRGLPRLGRRRTALLAVGLAAVAAVVILAVAAATADSAEGLLAVLVVGLLGVQAVTLLGVAYVARHVRRTRVHRDQIDQRILRRIGVLEQRLKSTRQQVRNDEQRTRQLIRGVKGGVESLAVQNSRAQGRLQEAAKRRHLSSTRQVQALGQLDRLVEITGPVPPMGGWAASPDLVVLVLEQLLERRPKVVVECGSGVTTLFTALAIEQHGLDCRIISLDHEEEFAGQTQRLLERHGVAHHVDLRCVPLEPTGLPGHDTPWYSRTALEGIDGVGLLVIDGPPEMTGEQARYPAMPLLQGRFAPDALVIMDDVIRAEDKRTAQRWAEENPAFSLAIRNDLEKYAGLLTRVV